MKRLILGGLLAAVAVVGSVRIASAADDTGAFYVSPMLQYDKLDAHREADQNYGWQLGLGYDFAPGWASELDYSQFSTPHRAGGAGLRLYEYNADIIKKFFPDSIVQPYLLVGAGGLDDVVPHYGHTSAVDAEAGGGLMVGLGPQTGRYRMQMRAEAKYRREFIDTNFTGNKDPSDVIFGVGFQFMFGAPVPPPPKAVVVAPPPDSDGDGVPDDIDRCPNTPAGAKVDQYGCEFDQDGDGVVDRLDQCPNTPHGTPVDAKGCPLDSDGDGVPDTLDKCPNTPKGDRVDSVGCTIRDEIKLQGVNFATDSADLVSESDVVLSYAVDTLKKYPNLVIEVRGHTDNRGSKKHNLALSQRRADSVLRYLKDHGVTNSMTAKGYGEDKPIADNKTADGRMENRRVTLRIISGF
ncbi:MAG TPA: OmpA family protein [Steroidobacteraceae bacterium]|nr:OmpA family protein [Steroidobacteraceae bacterium]